MTPEEIRVGQRFESIGVYQHRVWQVEDIYRAANDLVHARLRDVKDSLTECTLAPSALLDSTRFRPLGQQIP